MIDTQTKTALRDAVRAAGRAEILPRFRNLSAGQIASKTSRDDLVTIADQRAEEMIAKAVRDILPGAFILGEEAAADDPSLVASLGSAEVSVIIDPIDGTWNYAHGLGNFGTLLAVMIKDKPVYGLLYDPCRDDWIEAEAGSGAWFTDQSGNDPRRLSAPAPQASLADMSGFIPVRQFPLANQHALHSASYHYRQSVAIRCSCHEYRLMALGLMDFAISSGTKPWDHVAGQIVLNEIGGASARPGGRPYSPTTDGMLIAASHPQTLKMVSRHLTPALT